LGLGEVHAFGELEDADDHVEVPRRISEMFQDQLVRATVEPLRSDVICAGTCARQPVNKERSVPHPVDEDQGLAVALPPGQLMVDDDLVSGLSLPDLLDRSGAHILELLEELDVARLEEPIKIHRCHHPDGHRANQDTAFDKQVWLDLVDDAIAEQLSKHRPLVSPRARRRCSKPQ
jgi:hypothetical protein